MSYIQSILLGMAGLLLAGAVSAQPAQGLARAGFEPCPDPGQAIASLATPCLAMVLFGEALEPGRGEQLLRGIGAAVRFDFPSLNGAAVLVPNERVYWALANDQRIARLIPDRRLGIAAPPNRCSPWPACKNDDGGGDDGGSTEPPLEPGTSNPIPAGVKRIGADQVWGTATGRDVTVWVVDTGVDASHADLAGGYIGGVSCLGSEAEAGCAVGGQDDHGHGTHVAGIVGARHNDIDVVGVAPDAGIFSVKVLDSTGNGYDSNLIAGLEYIAGSLTGVDVVNISLGRMGNCASATNGNDPGAAVIGAVLEELSGAGVAVVVAAGNDPDQDIANMVPAGCPQVVAVASSTAMKGNNKCKAIRNDGIPRDTASYFTTDGVGVMVSAPGSTREDNNCATIQFVGIESLKLGGGTTAMSGTSMAAPHVAGLAALVLETGADATMMTQNTHGVGTLPLTHPYQGDDGIKEGIACAPATLGLGSCN